MAITEEVTGSKTTVITGTITSSSVANPSQILIDASHGLQTGDSVLISGHSGSTPSINNRYEITLVDADEFTIPVNVTVGGTGGTITEIEQLLTPLSGTSSSNLRAISPELDNMANGDVIVVKIYRDDGAGNWFLQGDPMVYRDAQGNRSPQSGAFAQPDGGKFTVESQAGVAVAVGFSIITGE